LKNEFEMMMIVKYNDGDRTKEYCNGVGGDGEGGVKKNEIRSIKNKNLFYLLKLDG